MKLIEGGSMETINWYPPARNCLEKLGDALWYARHCCGDTTGEVSAFVLGVTDKLGSLASPACSSKKNGYPVIREVLADVQAAQEAGLLDELSTIERSIVQSILVTATIVLRSASE